MNLRKVCFILTFTLGLFAISNFAYGQDEATSIPKLIVFHSLTCHRCIQAKIKIIPDIEKQFKGLIIEYRDINDIENYKFLLSLKRQYNPKLALELPVFYFKGNFSNGIGNIRVNLQNLIYKSLYNSDREVASSNIDLIAHFKTFTPVAIISAGLIDGINPCAFTVIVFFISFLALQGYKRRELVVIGICFISAVFFTYFLLGLGIFNFLYQLRAFWVVTKIANIVIGAFSILLGIAAVYDFLKFKKSGETEGLLLQLPQSIKNRIHYVIGLYYRKTKESQPEQATQKKYILRLVITALITGFLVSLLEAVCTGQTYLPTISFILKTTSLKLQALGYLLIYNLMFILPLFIIFLFALFGTTSEQFSVFLRRRMLTIKILMAIIFFGLGIFLIWRA